VVHIHKTKKGAEKPYVVEAAVEKTELWKNMSGGESKITVNQNENIVFWTFKAKESSETIRKFCRHLVFFYPKGEEDCPRLFGEDEVWQYHTHIKNVISEEDFFAKREPLYSTFMAKGMSSWIDH
jgi:hypothetical protein